MLDSSIVRLRGEKMGIYYFCSGFDKKIGFGKEISREIINDLKTTNNLLFIPGFNQPEKITMILELNIPRFIEFFKKINIEFDNIDCILLDTPKEEAQKLIKKADMIIMLGGNPFQVRELLMEKEIINALKEYDKIIMGISAGAMNMSKYIITTPCNEEFNTFNIIEGLNLCNISIFPHCNFEGEIFPKSFEYSNRKTKRKDLQKVANDYEEFYCLQDYKRNDNIMDISIIKVKGNEIKFIKDNNSKIWIIKKEGIFLV